MTEYWVSQGNKWCDYCKIFLSNNPAGIRNHELGTRHKENVTKKLATLRKDKATKDKEAKAATKALEQIEAKAKSSYQKDVTTFKEARESNSHALTSQDDDVMPGEWEFESSTGYYYNQSTFCYYDPNSGFYYTDALGKWVTQEEALAASRLPSTSNKRKPIFTNPSTVSESKPVSQNGLPPVNPVKKSLKNAPSSLTVNKRKKTEGKPKVVSEEEKAALKAREAARKRVEAREKSMLGLYTH
jgi:WW domain-binding protein 4